MRNALASLLVLSWFLFNSLLLYAQPATGYDEEGQSNDSVLVNVYKVDREAKEAVYNIVRYSGLTPNFIITPSDVTTAVAYIKGRQRYISYNQEFITRASNRAKTDWAAISILAHEIGHHLLGHTLKNKGSNPGDELAADKYSGFILYRMGASLEEAKAAMEMVGKKEGTKRHPPRQARLEAITNGWLEAKSLEGTAVLTNSLFSIQDEGFLYQCTFKGDRNLYFVNDSNQIVWYDNYAKPIVIGKVFEVSDGSFLWEFRYQDLKYGVDHEGNIWNITPYGAMLIVGKAEELVHQHPIKKEGK